MKIDFSRKRWWDFPAIFLLIASLLTGATRLSATGWTIHLEIVQTVVVLGAILGFALGYSKFSSRLAGLFTILYGIFIIPWQLGTIMKDEILWPERLMILANRSGVIINQIVHQEIVQDSLLFLMLMIVLFWILSVSAGFTLVRLGNAWLAILPTGLVILIFHSLDPLIPRRVWYLVFYLFFTLVLVARMVYLHNQSHWRQSRTALPPHLGLEFLRITLLATALIVLLAWTVPALANSVSAADKAWQPVRDAWNISRDHFDNAFASLRSSSGVLSDYYGKSALLGRGNLLTDTQLFTVRTANNIPKDIRLYWRARTYDTYENGQWKSTKNKTQTYKPEDSKLTLPKNEGRITSSFEFILATNLTTLFTPPQPKWVSRNSLVELAENPDGTVDISTFRASPDLEPGQVYISQSSITHASIPQLKESGNDYPVWITDRYLQLPESITPRTRKLALDITADLDNPYEKVVAITHYLRNNIEYTDIVPEQPDGVEAIDWILFDLKQGFCNYYATTEVVMLRSLGIPARFSIGYAQGEFTQDGEYLIRQRDAHSWPEVYFPNIGWVEFEPTASQSTIVRPVVTPLKTNGAGFSPDSEYEEMEPRDLEREEDAYGRDPGLALSNLRRTNQIRIALSISAVLISVILLYIVWRFRSRIYLPIVPIVLVAAFEKAGIRPPRSVQSWAQHAALSPLSKAYIEINRALSRLGDRPSTADTPAERARSLGELLSPVKYPATQLVTEYEKGTFSLQSADLEKAQNAGAEIKTHSYQAYFQRLINRLLQPRRKRSHPLFEGRVNRKY
jgi:transglutaminase-like putative cysteine protease